MAGASIAIGLLSASGACIGSLRATAVAGPPCIIGALDRLADGCEDRPPSPDGCGTD
jgi:hypothetical protein